MNRRSVNLSLGVMIALMMAFLIAGCGDVENELPSGADLAPPAPPAGGEFAPGHILVKFKPDANVPAINTAFGTKTLDVIPGINVHVIEIPPVAKPENMVERFKRNPNVEYAELDGIAYALVTPNDTYFDNQWGLNNTGQNGGTPDADIDAPEAWDITKGSSTVKIAILDTGIDQDHEDLSGKIVANKNFTTSRTVNDNYGHGTHVAGIAAAVTDNGKGVAGTGWNSSLMNVKVLGDNGSGYYSWVANGINWAANNGAKVINMSLGGSSSSSTLESAVNYAWNKGVVLVAAAGNNNNNNPTYPAYYANCIAVAATDHKDNKATFSSYGENWVDVAAPGVNIYSTLPNHKNKIGQRNYGYLSGTSMSTPFVSGTVALVWATGYGTSNSSVRNRIESKADEITGTGTYWTYGRVNAYNAVNPETGRPSK